MYGPPYYTSPADPDDRWEAIAERLESEYATGAKLRDIAETEFEELNIVPDLIEIFDGHVDDIDGKAIRLIRGLLKDLQKRIEREAREDAEAEVARMDDDSEAARNGDGMEEAA
ncbi:MAG TPA: hypothetical protein VIR54_07060 [Vicinamibacterales bacterium]|jgi:hypothetical protein